jgi:SAM-dependent methyltransferase
MILRNIPTPRPLIRRLKISMEPMIPLDSQQVSAVAQFREDIQKGKYSFTKNPCLCGGRNDQIVGLRDRYGLHVKTVLCQSCGLLRTDPSFDEESMSRFYDQYYRRIYTKDGGSPSALFATQLAHGEKIVRFVKNGGISFTGRVLEVGCGAGGILTAFRDSGAPVAGCDLGEPFLEYGRERGLSLEYGGAEALSQHAPAALVILAHVLEHFRYPVEELKIIRRLLSDGGFLYLEVPGLFWIKESYKRDLGKYLQNAHVYHFCLESLDYVLSLAGFSRVLGDERILAVYRKAATPIHYPHHLPKKSVKHLRKMERLRWARGLASMARRKISGLGNSVFKRTVA